MRRADARDETVVRTVRGCGLSGGESRMYSRWYGSGMYLRHRWSHGRFDGLGVDELHNHRDGYQA